MLLSPPTSPVAGARRRPQQQQLEQQQTPLASSSRHRPPSSSTSDSERPSACASSGSGRSMRRTRSRTNSSAVEESTPRKADYGALRQRNDGPRRPTSSAAMRTSQSGMGTPRSPSSRVASPKPSPSAYQRHQSVVQSKLHPPQPTRTPVPSSTADLRRAASTSVLQNLPHPVHTPASPPSPFLTHAHPYLQPPARPSSAAPHLGARNFTSSPRPSPREAPLRPARRISLNLPAEEDDPRAGYGRATSVVPLPLRESKGLSGNAEGSLRDVLGRFERSASAATLGRQVRKTFLRGRTTPAPAGKGESGGWLKVPGPLDLAFEREQAVKESESAMARWADGVSSEVPQAVLIADQERLSPLGEPFATAAGKGGEGVDGALGVPGSVRKRPSNGRMVSSPAHLGSPARSPLLMSSSPSADAGAALYSHPVSPMPTPTSPAAGGTGTAAGKKRTHSTSSSIVSSSLHRPAGSIGTLTSLRSESLRSTSAQRVPPRLAPLRQLTSPPLASPSEPVLTREQAATAGRTVSHPPPLSRSTFTTGPSLSPAAPTSAIVSDGLHHVHPHHHDRRHPQQTQGSNGADAREARSSSSFDLDRCVARCREVGDGWVSFASVGVGLPEGEESGSPRADARGLDDAGAGRRGWWSWLARSAQVGGEGQAR